LCPNVNKKRPKFRNSPSLFGEHVRHFLFTYTPNATKSSTAVGVIAAFQTCPVVRRCIIVCCSIIITDGIVVGGVIATLRRGNFFFDRLGLIFVKAKPVRSNSTPNTLASIRRGSILFGWAGN
jgi:hypothetical protein